jgi:precorrin-2 dehydrogenase / sirohydrochlorin ferrochelatase
VSGYPVLLEGTRIEALVVGGGPVADRKVAALVECGARVRVVATEMCPSLRARLSSHPTLTIAVREFVTGDIGDATLVIAATNVRAVNARVAADAGRLGRLVNVVDAPDEGHFVTVAAHRAEPLVIGVSSGAVPGAAARVRDAIASRFDSRFQSAIIALTALRRRLITSGDRDGWSAVERELLDESFCERVETGVFRTRYAEWESRLASGPAGAR